ncbi:MAG: Stp1/IreP family PP2C-type Ser/Thr phosphatase [Deltaproteobacteria bacterium]|nr:Stp1/IreP family PP2C-type Ser/Thr phosphatase [Deltaproteobacteria bacterium]
MTLRVSGLTDTGMKRTHNEDFLYVPDDERLVVVADGMGGHASGDVASRMAVETVVEFFAASVLDRDITWPFAFDRENRRQENRLITGIKLANLKIFESAQRDSRRQGMGTTIVAGIFCDDDIILAHVGDSRIYRLRDGALTQLSEDHSLLNDYIKMKRITPEDAENFPHKNVIVRALGMKDTAAVDHQRQAPRLGDMYLFCSDGLSGMLSDDEILRIVMASSIDLDRACLQLIEAANKAGGVDNITVALASLDGGG